MFLVAVVKTAFYVSREIFGWKWVGFETRYVGFSHGQPKISAAVVKTWIEGLHRNCLRPRFFRNFRLWASVVLLVSSHFQSSAENKSFEEGSFRKIPSMCKKIPVVFVDPALHNSASSLGCELEIKNFRTPSVNLSAAVNDTVFCLSKDFFKDVCRKNILKVMKNDWKEFSCFCEYSNCTFQRYPVVKFKKLFFETLSKTTFKQIRYTCILSIRSNFLIKSVKKIRTGSVKFWFLMWMLFWKCPYQQIRDFD